MKDGLIITIDESIAELQEEVDEWQAEIAAGDRDEEDGYDISTFQIICDKTEIAYELDLVAGKVVVIHGTTNNLQALLGRGKRQDI